jgi:hypothetical protein
MVYPKVLATPKPNVSLLQPTDPPYYCCYEQEWKVTIQAPLLADNSQDPSTMEDAPTGHDKLINPATKLPDPAPNLANEIASQVIVHGESFKTPWPKQEYLEVSLQHQTSMPYYAKEKCLSYYGEPSSPAPSELFC